MSGLGQKRKAEEAPAAAPAVRRGVLDTMLLGGDSDSGSDSDVADEGPSCVAGGPGNCL